MQKTYSWWLAILGALFAAPSVISVVQRELSFGLAPAFARMVDFYRSAIFLLAKAVHFMEWPLIRDLSVDYIRSLLDSVPIAVVVCGALLRSIWRPDFEGTAILSAAIVSVSYLVVGTNPFPWLLTPLYMGVLSLVLGLTFKNDVLRSIGAALVVTWLATAVAVAAFYIGNLVALS